MHDNFEMVQVFEVLTPIVQIGFWVTIGSIAILTYKRASKSLLQPVKTEVFKLQVKRLQEMLEEFPWRDSVEAWEKSGLEECLAKNSFKMLQRYGSSSFDIEIIEEKKACRDAVGGMFTKRWAEENLILITPERPSSSAENAEQDQDWIDYHHGDVDYFDTFHQISSSLRAFLSDPLIPERVAMKVDAVSKAHMKGLDSIGTTLTAAAKKLPHLYPTLEDLKSADLVWVSNEVDEKQQLFEELKSLREEVRSYLGSDRLLEF